MGSSHSLEDDLIQFKLTSKQMQRSSQKCEKNKQIQKEKMKQAMKSGNVEGAKIYAENVIRETHQGLNFLRLSSRIDAVASRLETAIRMQSVSKAMGTTVKGMSNVMKSMEIENISKVMEEFEKQFENMDVKSKHMENTMQSSSATIAPPEMVENLMREVAAEAGLEFSDTLQPAPTKNTTLGTPIAQEANKEVDDLELRLQALRK